MQRIVSVEIHNPDFPVDFVVIWACTIDGHTLRVADIDSIITLAVLLGATIVTSEPGIHRAAQERGVLVQAEES